MYEFCAFADVALERKQRASVYRDRDQTGVLQICGGFDDGTNWNRREAFPPRCPSSCRISSAG